MAKPMFDPFYVAKVLEELLSKQYGCQFKITLTPKERPIMGEESEKGG